MGYDDNDGIGDIKSNYLTTDNYICNTRRMRSCKTKRYCSYNRVVYTLDHMRNRTEVAYVQRDDHKRNYAEMYRSGHDVDRDGSQTRHIV